MPGLNLISGNMLEVLADRCGSVFKDEPLPPMTGEIIVLQSMGMMQWLSIRLAESLGIWADFEYVLPNRMTARLLKSFFPSISDERFFDKDIMTWKTLKLLRENRGNPVYSVLSEYMGHDPAGSGIREFQLCSRIADLFDQYMTFRPDMILRWDRGEFGPDEEWQPHLWRGLTGGMGVEHPPALLEKLFVGINSGTITRPSDLPARISVFGISYLPLYHFNVLRAASNFCDVYFYMLNPCQEFWAYVMGEKEITGLVSKEPIVAQGFEDELHIERGNRLLSSMGRAGRDFFRFLYMSDIDSGEERIFEEPRADSLLHIIQNDILNMTARGLKDRNSVIKLSEDAAGADRSIVINSCHSIMREVEVLHDYLLDLFNSSSDLSPGDVLVMTPDIESCSSIIQGVFDRMEEGVPRIPYRVVDRSIGNTSGAVDAFMKILSLKDGRFTSVEVMGILQCPEVCGKFGLTGDDYDMVTSWVKGAGIYWGIDSQYKGELELPEINENTWNFGIERMLLGSVMKCDGPVFGSLPYDGIEGNNMQVLGRFLTYFSMLCDTFRKISGEHTLAEWSDIIKGIALNFFDSGQGETDDMLEILRLAARLRDICDGIDFNGKVGLLPVREFIEMGVNTKSAGRNFITGSLTFCEMLPMRSIPCRVICLIGMNEYSFPRKSRPSGFDLMMKKPRTGDRSVRDEDRYLFLETVISARECLYISYTGQNIITNEEQNPSIVVSELMEYIEQSFATESGVSLKEMIFKKQKLQAYHPLYFTKDSGYYSYSPGRRTGALSYLRRDSDEYSFFAGELPPLTEDEKNITLDELADFLVNPSRYVIKRRLGVNLENYGDDFIVDEPFIPGNLEKYNLDDRMLRYLEKGLNRNEILARIKADGILPHGSPGIVVFNESVARADRIFNDVKPLLVNMSIEEREIEINGFRLRFKNPVYNGKFVFYRAGKLRATDRVRAWLYHIAACYALDCEGKFSTVFIAADDRVTYRYAEKSGEVLGSLVALYEEGMIKPAPLFPLSSYEFARSITEKGKDESLRAASGKFKNSWSMADIGDQYIYKLFGDSYSPDEEFCRVSGIVYSPIIEHEANGGL